MLNNKIRREFNKTESSIWAYQALVVFTFLYIPSFIISVFTDKFYIGLISYISSIVLNFAMIKIMYYLRYKSNLEEEYQWGNVDFLGYEDEYLERLYNKDKITYEEYEDYLEENSREVSEEDIHSYSLYKQKGIVNSRVYIMLIAIMYVIQIKLIIAVPIAGIISMVLPYDKLIVNVERTAIYKRGISYWESEESEL